MNKQFCFKIISNYLSSGSSFPSSNCLSFLSVYLKSSMNVAKSYLSYNIWIKYNMFRQLARKCKQLGYSCCIRKNLGVPKMNNAISCT